MNMRKKLWNISFVLFQRKNVKIEDDSMFLFVELPTKNNC
jgi:hypothetical protein